MRRIAWPAVGGVVVTVAAFVYLYLALNHGQIGAWSNGPYAYSSPPSVRTTLVVASIVGLLAAGIAALPVAFSAASRIQIIVIALVDLVVFVAFALLVVPVMIGPGI